MNMTREAVHRKALKQAFFHLIPEPYASTELLDFDTAWTLVNRMAETDQPLPADFLVWQPMQAHLAEGGARRAQAIITDFAAWLEGLMLEAQGITEENQHCSNAISGRTEQVYATVRLKLHVADNETIGAVLENMDYSFNPSPSNQTEVVDAALVSWQNDYPH